MFTSLYLVEVKRIINIQAIKTIRACIVMMQALIVLSNQLRYME